jgi:tetratricopeptide (TPR) repeat protein
MTDFPARRPGRTNRARIVLIVLVLAPFSLPLVWWVDWTSSQSLYRQARSALERRDFQVSLHLGRRLMARKSHRTEGLLFVAESSAQMGDFDEALRLLKEVPADNRTLSETAALLTARIECDDLHRPADAERTLRKALQIDPESLPAHEKLAFILGLAGRSWEAVPHRLALIGQDQFPVHHLSLLALGNTAAENPDLIAGFAKSSPDDPDVQCGLARIALRDGRIDEGERLLDEIIRRAPSLFAAQAWKGEVLLNRRDHAALAAWHAALPDGADEFPDVWFVRGQWAAQRNEPRVAARCFWECLRRDPHHQTASYQLANLLGQLGDVESADLFRQHAKRLGDLIMAAKTVEITGRLDAAERAAEACDALGMFAEARAWRQVLRGSNSTFHWDPQQTAQPRPASGSPRVDPRFDPTHRVDLASYPLPKLAPASLTADAVNLPSGAAGHRIAFVDDARAVGIDFLYRNGSTPGTDGEYIHEFSGGGVAAFDYDLDGWPDLYFTQGSDRRPDVAQDKLLDRLYRNRGDGRFEDITTACGIREVGFSQGCAVGDFDNDGFPDLYVANIGANRFYHNNGDGTFTDVTQQTGTAGDRWTTSCAIADFNGDGNPDLFTVNYVTGKDLFSHTCRMADGSPRLCTPHEFPAAHDQLFISLGDGRFEDQSASAGIEVPEGKGLGVVAADFDRSGRLSLFVANDAVPNFYLYNVTSRRGDMARFEERGYLSGLAVDADGQPQACMGVASGDANGDGLLDLYVSNFRNESNTLYLQQPDGNFVDATRQSGLREPSYAMLGFGTQFLDADLDGREDLVLTNGHVGNLKHHGVAYEMPPQFFHNRGQGRFAELPGSTLGRFFAGAYLGRGLARLDWNRDGREDFAVSHLKSPAALVTNQTASPGNSLAVQLRGVDSARDAIGTTVTVTAGGRQHVRQLTAGDGYQASNEHQLVFGVGDAGAIERMQVNWPSGMMQSFSNLDANSNVLVIEGRPQPVVFEKP